jgi:DNA helicase HerA-like ATPase
MEEKASIKISYNKRVLFIGKTRSGKSYLSRFLVKQFMTTPDLQVIIIDPKHEWKKFGDGSSLDRPLLVTKYEKDIKVQVFQTFEWIPALDTMIDKILKRGKAIVVFDELGGLATASQVPNGITRLWTQGGGMGVGSWALIQQPKRVPLVIKSQSEIFFMFRINSAQHRKDIQDFIPDDRVIKNPLPNRYFWLYEEGMDKAVLIKPIK